MPTYDEYAARVIATADRFFATSYKGKGTRLYETVEAGTLDEARRRAADLYEDRPVAIYAVAGARQVHVENFDPGNTR
jgi:hypothetical protein